MNISFLTLIIYSVIIYSAIQSSVNSMQSGSVIIYQAPGKPALGTVLDGTKCGDKMVCKDNKCVSLSVAYGGQRTCVNNCNGNGVCNENGCCHCNPGWKYPNCSVAYNDSSGSSDNGLSCQVPATTPTPTTILATSLPPATTQATTPPPSPSTASTTAVPPTPQTEQSFDKILNDKILIAMIIVSVCFLFLLLVVSICLYTNQCRFRQNTNGQPNSKQTHKNEAFDSTQKPAENPTEVWQNISNEQHGTASIPRITTGQELTQEPGHASFGANKEPASFYQPPRSRDTSVDQHYLKTDNEHDRYKNAAFVVAPSNA